MKNLKNKEYNQSLLQPTNNKSLSEEMRVQRSWQILDAFLSKNYPKLFDRLQPGASKEDIAEAEKTFGLKFPEYFKFFYLHHNGQSWNSNGPFLLDGFAFLPLDKMVKSWKNMKKVTKKLETEDWYKEEKEKDKDWYWSEKWLPFAKGTTEHDVYLCLNLDSNSKDYGKVINFDYEDILGVENLFIDWLEELVEEVVGLKKLWMGNFGYFVSASQLSDKTYLEEQTELF